MDRFVKTVVDRARHVAITNGFKRYLHRPELVVSGTSVGAAYHAAIATPSHLICLRNELYRRPVTDSAESEMVIKAFAFKRSITVKSTFVASGYSLGFGSKEKIGRRRGA